MSYQRMTALTLLVCGAAACRCGGGGGAVSAPTQLSYRDGAPVYTRSVAVAPNAPSVEGGSPDRYVVAPALPAGLHLDPVTGVISGTPDTLAPAATYVVTASNAAGSASTTLSITVVEAAPSLLAYTDPTAVYTVGAAISPNTPSCGGGAVVSFSVTPPLPAGLELDPVTGVVSGTPTSVTASAGYLVTATNGGGSASALLTIEVVDAPSPAVTLARYVTAGKAGLTARTQPQPAGTALSWSVAGGILTGGQGSSEITFTAGSPGPLTITVHALRGGVDRVGSATATIVPPPSARIFAQDRVFPGTPGILASVPAQRDVTVTWTLDLPGGAITAGAADPVLTYRSGASLGPYQLTATVENLAGDLDTDRRALRVVSGEFLSDPSAPRYTGTGTTTLLPDGRLLSVGGAGAELFDPPTGTWAGVGPMITPRGQHTATLLPGGKVLIAGGTATGAGAALASAELYDPATRTLGPAPSMACVRAEHVAALLADGRVLVAGGGPTPTAAAERFDPASNRWEPAASMGAARLAHRASLLADGQVLVTGGWNGDALDTAERYDPTADRWFPAGTIGAPRHDHVSARLPSGRVLVTGGMSLGPSDATAFVFDPTDGWTAVGSMAEPRSAPSAAVLADGRVLVAGGRQGNVTSGSAEVFDEALGVWSPAASLAQPRAGHTSTLLPGGSVLALGGYVWNGEDVGIAERYAPAADAWTPTGAPALPTYHTATVLADGRLLVAGGVVMGAGEAVPQAGAALYDPATRRWTATGAMAATRWGHTASLLEDGRVLVVGGKSEAGYSPPSLATAELYDPVTGTWSPAASLAFAREAHAAVRLADGRVLVAGGATAACEVYDPAADRWTRVGDLAATRGAFTATLLPSGRVLAVGGSGTTGAETSAELFDPSTGRWAPTGSPTSPRASHAATLLGDGTVLVSGGGSLFVKSSETYDPAAGTFEAAGDLAAGRSAHRMLALPDGGAVVFFGYPDDASRYPETFDPASRTWSRGTPAAAPRDGVTASLLAGGTVVLVRGLPAPTLFWRR
jgi:hypothetical protein